MNVKNAGKCLEKNRYKIVKNKIQFSGRFSEETHGCPR